MHGITWPPYPGLFLPVFVFSFFLSSLKGDKRKGSTYRRLRDRSQKLTVATYITVGKEEWVVAHAGLRHHICRFSFNCARHVSASPAPPCGATNAICLVIMCLAKFFLVLKQRTELPHYHNQLTSRADADRVEAMGAGGWKFWACKIFGNAVIIMTDLPAAVGLFSRSHRLEWPTSKLRLVKKVVECYTLQFLVCRVGVGGR